MAHPMSRAQRRAAFLECTVQMSDALEEWYDEHPDASFGEIEAEPPRQRRELMGQALAILINGRDRGFQLEAPPCEKCGQPMEFQRYRPWTIYGLEGDTKLERAYYLCPNCAGGHPLVCWWHVQYNSVADTWMAVANQWRVRYEYRSASSRHSMG